MNQDFEVKYTARNQYAPKIRAWMDCNLTPDPEYPETYIHSIYYDTQRLQYLEEKNGSDNIKSKFRIRWYQDKTTKANSPVAFLEFKHKIGDHRFKRRIKVENNFSNRPLENLPPLMEELRNYEGYNLPHVYPAFIISYTRKRYVYHNLRPCIDYNIHISRTNSLLIPDPFYPIQLNNCVVELKGETAIMPRSLFPLEKMGLKKSSFSKYERCFYELIQRERTWNLG